MSRKKIGLSKKMPPSEARPLGTKTPRTPKLAKTVGDRIAEIMEKDGFCDVTMEVVSTYPKQGAEVNEILQTLDDATGGRAEQVLDAIDAISEYNALQHNSDLLDLSHQPAIPPATVSRSSRMTLVYVKTSKNGKRAIYSGAANSLVFPLTAFPGKTAPATITDLSAFAEKAVKTPRAKLTKEERAALPKPTIAERAKKAQDRADKLAKQAAAASAM